MTRYGLRTLFWALVCVSIVHGALNDPFPIGYSMLNFGTIVNGNRISGRQPWIPAGFVKDTNLFWLAAAYVNYYAAMDNLADRDFRQAGFGLGFNRKKVCVKGAVILFNALGIYYEQKGYISFGVSAIPHLNASLEFEGYRLGLYTASKEYETMVYGGVSVWSPWRYASVSLTCRNIAIKHAAAGGIGQPVSVSLGIHTMPHRFGAQGVVVTVLPEKKELYQLCIGQDITVYRNLSMQAAVSARPFMASFGISFNLPAYGVYSALVYHPVLGWSQGVGMEYVKR